MGVAKLLYSAGQGLIWSFVVSTVSTAHINTITISIKLIISYPRYMLLEVDYLDKRNWPGVQPISGIIFKPILRPSYSMHCSLMQTMLGKKFQQLALWNIFYFSHKISFLSFRQIVCKLLAWHYDDSLLCAQYIMGQTYKDIRILSLSSAEFAQRVVKINPCPAEPGHTVPLQTV